MLVRFKSGNAEGASGRAGPCLALVSSIRTVLEQCWIINVTDQDDEEVCYQTLNIKEKEDLAENSLPLKVTIKSAGRRRFSCKPVSGKIVNCSKGVWQKPSFLKWRSFTALYQHTWRKQLAWRSISLSLVGSEVCCSGHFMFPLHIFQTFLRNRACALIATWVLAKYFLVVTLFLHRTPGANQEYWSPLQSSACSLSSSKAC